MKFRSFDTRGVMSRGVGTFAMFVFAQKNRVHPGAPALNRIFSSIFLSICVDFDRRLKSSEQRGEKSDLLYWSSAKETTYWHGNAKHEQLDQSQITVWPFRYWEIISKLRPTIYCDASGLKSPIILPGILALGYHSKVRGYNGIFYINQRGCFWSDPESSNSHKQNKKKIIKIGPLVTKWRQFPDR